MTSLQRKLYVPARYLAYQHTDSIREISKPLFDQYQVNFFDFTRIHFDGSWIFYTSHAGISQFLFDRGFAFLPYIDIKKPSSFILFSTIKAFEAYLAQLKQHFAIENVLVYINKKSDYVDVYWFAIKKTSECVTNFYLNHVDVFRNYTQYFNERAERLIKIADKDRIKIPSIFKQDYDEAFRRLKNIKDQANFLDFLLNKKALSFLIDGHWISISKRETECLKLIVKGCTAKKAADILGVSPRTIESHLDAIKLKLNCRTRSELISLVIADLINQYVLT